MITKKDGSFVTGKVLDEQRWGDDHVLLAPSTSAQTVDVAEAEVQDIKASPISPMPPALINRLNENELRDLMGYLMSLK